MSLKVVIRLRYENITSGAETVEVEAATIKEVLETWSRNILAFAPAYATKRDPCAASSISISMAKTFGFLENLATPVTDGAEIAIVPAISGGARKRNLRPINRGLHGTKIQCNPRMPRIDFHIAPTPLNRSKNNYSEGNL